MEQRPITEKLITTHGNYGNVIFMSGGCASGKSTAIKNYLENKYKVIDIDAWKESFIKIGRLKNKYPEIQNLDMKNPDDVTKLHSFISQLGIRGKTMELLLRDSKPDRLPNIVFDITGQHIESITDMLPYLIKAGYKAEKINLIWVLTDYRVALERNRNRSRTVSDEIVLKTHSAAAKTFLRLISGQEDVKGLNGSIHIVFGDDQHKVVYPDRTDVIKDFAYFQLKKAGQPIKPYSEFEKDLSKWVKEKTPLKQKEGA